MKERTYKNEGAVKKHIKQLLVAHGWMEWMPAQGGYGRVGVSDHNALKDGVFMAIEAKHEKSDKPTEPQKDYLRAVLHQGGFAFVVHKDTIRALEIFLVAFGRSAERQLKGEDPLPEDGAAMLDMINIMTEAYI